MLDDVISRLANCQSPICLGWHAAMVTGGLTFGLWLAHEFWGRVSVPPKRPTDSTPDQAPADAPDLAGNLVERLSSSGGGPLKNYLRETLALPESPVHQKPIARLASKRPADDGRLLAPFPYECDLTLVRGINQAIARGLKEEGIGALRDLANCPKGKWRDITGLLLLGELPFRERWQDQARELIRHVDAISGRMRLPAPRVIAPELIGEWFTGERVVAHASLGPVFDAEPALVDRLTEVEGISKEIALALGNLGIWRFKQLGLWTAGQVEEVSRRLNISTATIEEGAWISRSMLRHLDSYRGSRIWAESSPEAWQYEELLNQYPVTDFIQADPRYGIVYRETPTSADNLTQIRGVDGVTAESLRRAGVQRFRQIADWSEANVDAFTSRLNLVPGRIYTERWIPQANDLCDRWTD